MPIIVLKTYIHSPVKRCFDLSRSIDLHKISTEQTKEEAIAGTVSGLIGLNETVTWKANHLGFKQTLSTIITEFNSPDLFVDEMLSGVFKRFRHEHHFKNKNGVTLMLDHFDYTSPFGLIGKIADHLFLKRYMTSLLIKRNKTIKEFAESNKWKEVLL